MAFPDIGGSFTDEGLMFLVSTYFLGVSYTAPTWYLGLGFDASPGGYNTSPADSNTMARLQPALVNPPTTDDFADDGSRIAIDWSAGAQIGGLGVEKSAPPVVNLTALVIAPNTTVCFITNTAALGPQPLPAIILANIGAFTFFVPLPAPGDFYELTFSAQLQLS